MTRRFILGTAGHIDHGKTALIHALTGVDTDRLPDEKRRGITIDLGFARLPLEDDVEFGVVDVPGHEGFIRNMVAGATGIDVVLLVIAADEGVMPQTREHLAIVDLLGVRSGVAAVTKTDLVEDAWLELVLDDVRQHLARTALADAPLIPVSAETGEGLDRLREALADRAARVEERTTDDLFRLPIDRVFTVRGTGTVATGTVWSGKVDHDTTVRVLPGERRARVRGLQVHGQDRDAARAGERAALALAGVGRDELARGSVLATGAAWREHMMLTVRLRVLADAEWTVETRQRIRLHLGTAEVMARVALLEAADELVPGDEGWAQLRLEAPVVARAGDPFVIRSYSPITTIGGGRVVEPAPPKRKRLDDSTADRLYAVLVGSPEDAVAARLAEARWGGGRAARLAVDTPHAPETVRAAVERLAQNGELVRAGDRLFGGEFGERARSRVVDALETFHERNPLRSGMDWEAARRALPEYAAPEIGEWAIERLLDEGRLERRAGVVALAGFAPRLTNEQHDTRARLLDIHRKAGLEPPAPAELPPELAGRDDLEELLALMSHEDELVAVAPDRFVARTVLQDAIDRLRTRLGGRESLTPADFREVFPLSRKHLIPLLEYLDRIGVTARRGDERTVATMD